ncbi:MAG: 6,7-dimethyl-8-ribityllumazine synthase [Rhodospirillales bacterium]|nr:6,7-dimethyl-8-ribityllumazine synthase [Rhodospirillales bacterium]
MTHVLIIESRFYDRISDGLLDGAKHALDDAGASYDLITVPGAFEVPAALKMAMSDKYDAYVVLGCVIRGETSHYDLVCNESARGVYDLVLEHELALGNGIITVENEAQALARARRSEKDKGGGAAQAALKMLEIKRQLAS